MAEEDFVAFVGLLGPKIVRVGDLYWGEIRSFFYRPLLTVMEFHPGSIRRPLLARLGGVQYAVPRAVEANSHLNWLIFERTSLYSVASLDKNRRRQVKLAAREFTLRIMTDVEEFKQQAYPVYLSFYERTRYKVGERRRDRAYFAQWADALFAIPNVLILGAYQQGSLGGVSLSYQVKDSVFYATFFCHDEALDHHLSDLMLHTVRASAAVAPEVRQVIVGMFKGNPGLDDFYLLRGAKLVRQRARLEINPLTRFILQKLLPRQYAQLLGNLPDLPTGSADGDTSPVAKMAPSPTSPAAQAGPAPSLPSGPGVTFHPSGAKCRNSLWPSPPAIPTLPSLVCLPSRLTDLTMDSTSPTSTPYATPTRGGTPKEVARVRKFLLASAVLLLGFSFPLYQVMVFALNSAFYSYIVIVPFISGYLAWIERARYFPSGTPLHPGWAAALWAGGGGFLGWAGLLLSGGAKPPLADLLALSMYSLVLLIAGSAGYFLGRRTLRLLAFPLGFLIFLAPFPVALETGLETVLQHGSAAVAEAFFDVAQMPVMRQGTFMQLPGFAMQVAPECSGIRSTLALFLTSLVAGQLFLRSPWKRALLALVVIPLAFLRNGFRVFVIGQLCVQISPDMIHSWIHRQGGPFFFALSLIPFSLILFFLYQSEHPKSKATP